VNPRLALPRRRRAVAVATVLAVMALTAAGTGEYAAGRLIRDRIAAAAPGLGADLSVTEAGSALWDVVRQQIPRLDLTSDDATLGRLGPVDVQVRLDDVRFGGSAPTVGDASAAVTVPLQSVADSVQAAVPSATVDGVTADPAAGTLRVMLGPGGVVQLTLRPSLTDGRVGVTAVSADIFGEAMSADRLATLTSGLDRRAQHAYPLGLRATSVQVDADGLRVELTAGPGPIKPA
jgi:hypothetical protein